MSYYMGGDYYMAGGIFGAIGGALKGIASTVVGAVLPPAKPILNTILGGPGNALVAPEGPRPQVPVPGIKGTIQRALPGGASGYMDIPVGYHLSKDGTGKVVKNRRMNPGNAKALRRAIRREASFVSLAKRALKGSGYTFKRTGAPRGRKRARR